MSMGDRIKEKRIEKGLTMEQLADKIGVGKSAVNKWEKGYVENIKRGTIEQLAQALDCTPAYLFEWNESPAQIVADIEYQKKQDATVQRLLAYYELLNPHMKQELLDYALFLEQKSRR